MPSLDRYITLGDY